MPYISSCSIACGGHFGDRETVLQTLAYAKEFGVKVGAHPAYPDPDNFGRISMALSTEDLKDALRRQFDGARRRDYPRCGSDQRGRVKAAAWS